LSHNDGSGGDFIRVGWQTPSNTNIVVVPGSALASVADVDLSSIVITNNITNVTVAEGQPATFSVGATGTNQFGSAPAYQWYSNGVAISGAVNSTFTVAPYATLASSGATFKVAVIEPALTNFSSVATLTVTASPTFTTVSAGILTGGTNVGIKFSRWVDPATATNLNNYSITGATITAVTLRTNIPQWESYAASLGNLVELTLAQPLSGSASVNVQNVKDVLGYTAATATLPIQVVPNLTPFDVGISSNSVDTTTNWSQIINWSDPYTDPFIHGTVIPYSSNAFELTAGGSDIYNAFDRFLFFYTLETSANFEIRVRVISEKYSSANAKAGLMIRESLNAGSRYVLLDAESPSGANVFECEARLTNSPVSWLTNSNPNATNNSGSISGALTDTYTPKAALPNGWLRLVSSNNIFLFYVATNAAGDDWHLRESFDVSSSPYAATYIGAIAMSHDNTTYTTAELDNFSIAPITVYAPTLSLVHNTDGTVTISWVGSATLLESTTLSGFAASSETVTANGTTNSVTIQPQAATKFYRLTK
jgi:hypothetical protein